MNRSYGSRESDQINKITIHHAAYVGDAQAIVNHLQGSSYSANYVIGKDGEILEDLPWYYAPITSSNRANDMQAITIEVANSAGSPSWPISNATWNALLQLCVELCGRFDIDPIWTGNSEGTFTTHDMFTATLCPGPYLKDRMPELVNLVATKLTSTQSNEETPSRYNFLTELPDWAYLTISNLMDAGIINGNEHGLDLSEDMLRTIIIVDRMITHAINKNK